jgi:hypothetical protein
MPKHHLLFFAILAIAFLSCHNKSMTKENNSPDNSRLPEEPVKKATIDPNTDMAVTGTPYKVDSLHLNKDTLSVFVNYSGGCKKHFFQLISNGMYAKSLPPQLDLCLKHSDNEDLCKKLVMQELKFDVSGLKYKGSNSVILKIGEKKIKYAGNQ